MNKAWTQHLDPRAKLLAAVSFAIQVVLLDEALTIGIFVGLITSAAFLSGFNPVLLLARTRRVVWFLLFIVGTNVFTQDGTVMFSWGNLIATEEGLSSSLLLSLKLVLLFWSAILLVHSTTPAQIIDAINHWFTRFRRHLGSFTTIVTVALNFVPGLVRLVQTVRLSHLARGIDIDSSLVRKLRYAASALNPLFRTALRMSDQLAMAMESRCFDPRALRTSYTKLRFRKSDWILLGISMTPLLFSVPGRL